MRSAAIEVGSRAVRLLVADVSPTAIKPVERKVENFDLLRAVADGRGAATLAEIQRVVDQYKARAESRGAVKMVAFGTEALRRIYGSGDFPQLRGVEILSPKDEAYCSFLSGANGLKGSLLGNSIVSVDHGNGSLEIAFGTIGAKSQVSDWRSLPLGSNELVAMLTDCGLNLQQFAARIATELDAADLPSVSVSDMVIQGSVSTKIAWITVRPSIEDRYDGDLVQGHRTSLDGLNGLIAMIDQKPRSEWSHLSRVVDPRDKPTDQIHRLVTGCVLFQQLLTRLKLDSFAVSSLGTRHGALWRLADN